MSRYIYFSHTNIIDGNTYIQSRDMQTGIAIVIKKNSNRLPNVTSLLGKDSFPVNDVTYITKAQFLSELRFANDAILRHIVFQAETSTPSVS